MSTAANLIETKLYNNIMNRYKCLKKLKGSETANLKRTDKTKRTKGQTMIYKILHTGRFTPKFCPPPLVLGPITIPDIDVD
jgi:hypothetical protein